MEGEGVKEVEEGKEVEENCTPWKREARK